MNKRSFLLKPNDNGDTIQEIANAAAVVSPSQSRKNLKMKIAQQVKEKTRQLLAQVNEEDNVLQRAQRLQPTAVQGLFSQR